MAPPEEDVPFQSLYRRFRPSTFAQVRGQDHVVLALRNAVREGRVSHAYLFSGPRGTGKTSTARILAKALNCTDLHDGEPCDACPSCLEITRGTSMDVHELDAASNNGVDAMRDLVSRAALGTPGRQKVYIVDEVHMLSTAASNALLKTLEEPPAHVVFVLATTDPQKVLPTIRSRTQHFEFRLLGADTLSELLTQVRTDAGLELPDEALDLAVRRGRGSARDALSVLDQVAAADTFDDDLPELGELVEAMADQDAGRAIVAATRLTAAGFGPQQLVVDLIEHLRQGFLTLVAPTLVAVSERERPALEAQARRLGLPAVVRAMEVLGVAQVGMRDAPDPRVNLDVALVRLTHPDVDDSPAAVLVRLERLERMEGTRPVATHPAPEHHPAPAAPGDESPATDLHPAPPTPAGAPEPDGDVENAPSSEDTSPAAIRQRLAASGSVTAGDATDPTPATGTGPSDAVVPTPAPKKTLGALRREAAAGKPERPAGSAPQPASDPTDPGSDPSSAPPSGPTVDQGAPGVADRTGVESPPVRADAAVPVPDVERSDVDRPQPGGSSVAGSSVAAELDLPGLAELEAAWSGELASRIRPKLKAFLGTGHFVGSSGRSARFALPNEAHRQRCEEFVPEVESVVSEYFGRRVPITLVVDDGGSPAARPPRDHVEDATGHGERAEDLVQEMDSFDEDELGEVVDMDNSAEVRVRQVFPGAEEVE